MTIRIYHNPRCSKSRETLALLEQQDIEVQIETYLQKHYSVTELQALADKLGITDIRAMMRCKDELFKQLQLDRPEVTNAQLLAALSEHSALLERPIVVNGDKARIGRPPQCVLEIL